MIQRPNADETDIFVGGVTPSAESYDEMLAAIAASKLSPDRAARQAEAAKILAEVGIDPRTYGTEDPQALLDHWHRCVADLADETSDRTEDCDARQPTEVGHGRTDRSTDLPTYVAIRDAGT